VPSREAFVELADAQTAELVEATLASYLESMPAHHGVLLRRFRLVDVALKVVGVGSVGRRCLAVLLLDARDEPLVLQLKEAGPSVLPPVDGHPTPTHQGRRVVGGQRLLQASSDIFLGWSDGPDERHYYWRQLHDRSASPDLTRMGGSELVTYARLCGWSLAHAHARSGAVGEVAGYLGRGRPFVEAVTRFATSYADQAEADHAAYCRRLAI
jgi:uncharacterized protein (DUF2252 family)